MSDQTTKRVHIRSVPTDVIEVLRTRAKEQDMPLAGYLRDLLIKLAAQPPKP
ncbi:MULTISPECIES: hypothetical protein [Saccharothrix]|uniref:hypothetical protein n=1 Tax=Saccharothrix TaxID=2071 RepID=UPI00130139A7|nr:hypothetical protein [Saccharothrix sp. CB00851]